LIYRDTSVLIAYLFEERDQPDKIVGSLQRISKSLLSFEIDAVIAQFRDSTFANSLFEMRCSSLDGCAKRNHSSSRLFLQFARAL
jgi:hypothetical protein